MNQELSQQPELVSIIDDLYTCRLVILLESGPQTNKYHQIMLTQTQFKNVSDAIQKQMKQCTDPTHPHKGECFTVPYEGDWSVVVDDKAQSFYEEKDILTIKKWNTQINGRRIGKI